MSKVTLDMATFKALASDTRLDILRALDGKKMSLKDISSATNLNKATLHEHLLKLNEAGLVKRNEREGHKWVYYKLTWKGECLLHPENTKIVVMFTATFFALFIGIVQLINYVKGVFVGKAVSFLGTTRYYSPNNVELGYSEGFSRSSQEIAQTLADNFAGKGVLGNPVSPSDISIDTVAPCSGDVMKYASDGVANSSVGIEINNALVGNGGGSEISSNIPVSHIAIWHDPTLQYIAIICFVIFSVLLSVGVWRFWKNRHSKI